eukprot:SAG31_NODE_11198_length_1055_cov_1.238494_1_plen_85_part_10
MPLQLDASVVQAPQHIVNPELTLEDLHLHELHAHGFSRPAKMFLTQEGLAYARSNIDRMIAALAASQPERPPDRMVSQHQCRGGE